MQGNNNILSYYLEASLANLAFEQLGALSAKHQANL